MTRKTRRTNKSSKMRMISSLRMTAWAWEMAREAKRMSARKSSMRNSSRDSRIMKATRRSLRIKRTMKKMKIRMKRMIMISR